MAIGLRKAVRGLLGVKIIALCGLLWATFDGQIELGEKPLKAADSKDAASTKAADEPAAAADGKGEPAEGDGAASRTRKSFLANLLELPPLDPKTVQKDELGQYLAIAERKEKQLNERLSLLRRREEQLKGLESSIDQKLKLLDDERRFFAQTMQQEKDLKGERLTQLVAMYAKMEPKKAAPVMEKLDKDLVIELFKQLPQKQVTAILEGMSPDKSVQISEYYGRVRSTREYDVLKEMNQSLRKEFEDCKGMPAN